MNIPRPELDIVHGIVLKADYQINIICMSKYVAFLRGINV
jgi:hypothetical protein